MLKVAFDFSDNNELKLQSLKRQTTMIVWGVRIFFYILVIVWTVLSIKTGKFEVRMSIDILFLFTTAVFTSSLLVIKKQISRIDEERVLNINYTLMNINLTTYAIQTFVYCLAFILSFYEKTVVTNVKECRLSITETVIYWFLWASIFSRTIMTGYMNVKFSRSLEETNRRFVMVFNEDMLAVQQRVLDSASERDEKRKAQRRQQFYKDYADQQLSRIIVSFLKEKEENTSL